MMQNVKYAIAFVWGMVYAICLTIIVRSWGNLVSASGDVDPDYILPIMFVVISSGGTLIGGLRELIDHWNDQCLATSASQSPTSSASATTSLLTDSASHCQFTGSALGEPTGVGRMLAMRIIRMGGREDGRVGGVTTDGYPTR